MLIANLVAAADVETSLRFGILSLSAVTRTMESPSRWRTTLVSPPARQCWM